MTATEVMKELEAFGDAQTKKTHMTHGAKEPLFGVKVGDMKKILKKTKKNYELSLELFKTGNSDAMYLAGLMADEKKMTESDLNAWVKMANWSFLNEYAVPWVAAETPFGFKLGLEWIQSKDEMIVIAGWSTLYNFAMVNEDDKIDIKKYNELLDFVEKNLHNSPNRVKYVMNGFVISVGSSIKDLTQRAIEIANKIGTVTVDMNGTACKVPFATDYINKIIERGSLGKKKKTCRC